MRLLRSTTFLVFLLVVVCAAVAAGRWLLRPRPVFLVSTSAMPEDAQEAGNRWYWVERPLRKPQRLMRASQVGAETIATDDAIAGFDVEGADVAWTARHGKTWQVARAGSRFGVYQSDTAAGRPCLWNARLYWSQEVPARVDPSIPLPSLGPSSEIYAVDPGGKPAVIARVPMVGVDLVGHSSDALFAAGRQGPFQDAMTIYRIPLGAAPERVATETYVQPAAVAVDGTLYWVAPGQDSPEIGLVACVRFWTPRAGVRTFQDWLPSPGAVYASGARPWYVNRLTDETAFPLDSMGALPHSIAVPKGFGVLGVGATNFLLHRRFGRSDAEQLYLLPHP